MHTIIVVDIEKQEHRVNIMDIMYIKPRALFDSVYYIVADQEVIKVDERTVNKMMKEWKDLFIVAAYPPSNRVRWAVNPKNILKVTRDERSYHLHFRWGQLGVDGYMYSKLPEHLK